MTKDDKDDDNSGGDGNADDNADAEHNNAYNCLTSIFHGKSS